MRRSPWPGTFALVVALWAGIACVMDHSTGDARVDSTDYPDVLLHRGVPSGPEDWSFAPFSDQGAWFGFALPPDDRADLGGGFSGPFLMTTGRWVGPRLARVALTDVETGAAVVMAPDAATRAVSLPGLLRQELRLEELSLREELWFHDASTALLGVRVENEGARARSLQISWRGDVFPEEASLSPTTSGVRVEASEGRLFFLQSDRQARAAIVTGTSYELSLDERIVLQPGESIATSLVLSFRDREEDAPAAMPNVGESFARNRERWSRYLAAVDPGTGRSSPEQILAVKSLQTLVNNWRGPLGRMRFSALFPSSNVSYFNGFWAWDSWKHAVALVRFDPALAKDQVRAMFDHQNERGMVADVVYLDPGEDNWRDTKPPLAGWAIEMIHEATGDTELVRELYPKLVAYHEFWYRERDHDADGLCEYGSTDGTLEAARWESGMDNAVRFDHTEMLPNGPGAWSMSQESVDLNSYLYREKLALAVMAEALALDADAVRFRREASSLRTRIRQEMYDERSGWFYDIDAASGEIVPVQGPEGWIPLWAGVATEAQAARVRASLLDPRKFRTYVPFPTVARDDPGFSEGYWRGLVWLDQAYFAIEGLRRYGFDEDALALRSQLFENLAGATTPGEPLYENYDPLSGAGRNVKHFSWSAAHLLLLSGSVEFR